jgi:site-specific DNA-methyltransferase (adenine-specific)
MTWHEPIRLALDGVAHIETGEHYLMAQCDHATLAAALRRAGVMVDALIVDAPYSERTHAGHDGEAAADVGKAWRRNNGRVEKKIARRELDYQAWSGEDVAEFVNGWEPVLSGWMVSITDDVLFHAWRDAMNAAGRQTFQDVPCVVRGMTVRLSGDGPSSWATHAAVSRPRNRLMASWGTLDGAYVGPCERQAVTGGKPLWLMRAIVGDYSAPGDLVCDPCAGAGTTLVAAVELGRRAIGCEPDAGRYAMACKRLAKARPQLRMRLDVEATRGEQGALALGGE